MLSLQGQVFYSGFDPLTILKQKKKLGAKEGDHITLINIFLAFRHLKNPQARQGFCGEHKLNAKSLGMAEKIHEQLVKQAKRMGLKIQSSADDIEGILRCLVTAFFMNVAQLQADGSYRNLRNKEILYLHPTSILNIKFPTWVLYSEVVYTSKYYMREVSEIDPKWLLELASHYFQDQRVKQAQHRHGQSIISQNKYELTKPLIEQKEYDPLIGKSRIFKRKAAGLSIAQQEEGPNKKTKISLSSRPTVKAANNKLLSFADDEDNDN